MKKYIAFMLVFMLFACSLSVSASSINDVHLDAELKGDYRRQNLGSADRLLDRSILLLDNVDDLYVLVNETWAGRDVDFAKYLDANYYANIYSSKNSIAIVSSGDRTELFLKGTAKSLLTDEDKAQIIARFERRVRPMTPGAVSRAAKGFARDIRQIAARNKRNARFAGLHTTEDYIVYFLSQGLPVTLGVVLGPVIGAVLTTLRVHRFRLRRRSDRIGRYSKVNR